MKYADDMDARDGNFEAAVTRALERGAEVSVPVDFAARVRAALPAVKKPKETARLGRMAALAAGCLLAVGMFVVAPHAAPTFGNWAFDFELVTIAELGGIAYWLTVRREV